MFEGDVGVVFAEDFFLEFQLAVLYCGDTDAVDVSDSAVGETQAGEDTELQILFAQVGEAQAQTDKAVAVNGVEGALHLIPLTRGEGDMSRAAAIVRVALLPPVRAVAAAVAVWQAFAGCRAGDGERYKL